MLKATAHPMRMGFLQRQQRKYAIDLKSKTESDAKALAQKDFAEFALAQQDLISCGSSNIPQYRPPFCLSPEENTYTGGCNGATAEGTLFYIHDWGLADRTCIPYVSGGGSYEDHFDLSEGNVPKCMHLEAKECHAQRSSNRVSKLTRCEEGDIACIKKAIKSGGPVYASFMVTDAFMAYQAGTVYSPKSTK